MEPKPIRPDIRWIGLVVFVIIVVFSVLWAAWFGGMGAVTQAVLDSAKAAVELAISCSGSRHHLRWDAGEITLVDHPDVDAELALVAGLLHALETIFMCVAGCAAGIRNDSDLISFLLQSQG